MEEIIKKKYAWHDIEKGYYIYAGGILLYDEENIWVIKEMINGCCLLNDPGGKYNIEDGDIYATIFREFNEETYNTFTITRQQIIEGTPVYVCLSKKFTPTYLCMFCKIDSSMNLENDIKENRKKVLLQNPDVPESWYSSVDFVKIPFSEIFQNFKVMSYRLKQIVTRSFLKKYTIINT